MSEDPIIDRSHVDSYLRSRHRVEVLNSAWKPALAGAAGATAIIGAVVVGVWVAQPRFAYRDIEIPRVTLRDVTADHVIPRDVTINNPVPHDVLIDIPRIVSVTPTEKRFIDSPAFAAAPMHGRIVSSRSERALSFDDGTDYTPTLPGMAADAVPLLGLWGYCSATDADKTIFHCFALLRDGTVVSVPQKPVGRPT